MEGKVVVAGREWAAHFGVFICSHVYQGSAVRLVVYERDGDLCFLCGDDGHETDKSELAGLIHVLEHHPEIADLPSLQIGEWAEKPADNSSWIVGELDSDDQEEGINP